MKEIWKKIKSFKMYKISNFGQVYSLKTDKILKSHPNGRGYLFVVLYKKGIKYSKPIHRLVIENFICPAPLDKRYKNKRKECNHKDGDKLNNYIENLEWVTRYENMKHANDLGLMKYFGHR